MGDQIRYFVKRWVCSCVLPLLFPVAVFAQVESNAEDILFSLPEISALDGGGTVWSPLIEIGVDGIGEAQKKWLQSYVGTLNSMLRINNLYVDANSMLGKQLYSLVEENPKYFRVDKKGKVVLRGNASVQVKKEYKKLLDAQGRVQRGFLLLRSMSSFNAKALQNLHGIALWRQIGTGVKITGSLGTVFFTVSTVNEMMAAHNRNEKDKFMNRFGELVTGIALTATSAAGYVCMPCIGATFLASTLNAQSESLGNAKLAALESTLQANYSDLALRQSVSEKIKELANRDWLRVGVDFQCGMGVDGVTTMIGAYPHRDDILGLIRTSLDDMSSSAGQLRGKYIHQLAGYSFNWVDNEAKMYNAMLQVEKSLENAKINDAYLEAQYKYARAVYLMILKINAQKSYNLAVAGCA